MQTLLLIRSYEQMDSSRRLPVYYLLFFGIVFLISLWAEIHRRRQPMNGEQKVCSWLYPTRPSPTTMDWPRIRALPNKL